MRSPSDPAVRRFARVGALSLALKVAAVGLFLLLVLRWAGGR